jgi:hypothetical protein
MGLSIKKWCFCTNLIYLPRSGLVLQVVIHNIKIFQNNLFIGVTIVKAHLDWTLSIKSRVGQDNLEL